MRPGWRRTAVVALGIWALLGIAVGHGAPGAERRLEGLAQVPAGGRLFLPFLRREVACEAACRTATARVTRTPRTATPTGRPSLTPSPSATASPTPGPSDTATNPPTASPTGSATPTATASPRPPVRTRTPTATASLTPFPTAQAADPARDRLVPLAALAPVGGKVLYQPALRSYRLQLEGSPPLTFELDLTHPDNANGRLALRHVQSNRYPVAGAGLYYRNKDGALLEPRILRLAGSVSAVDHEALADGLRLTVRETLDGSPHAKRYTLRMVGRALAIRAESLDGPGPARGSYAGFGGGALEGSSDGVDLRIPYMAMVPLTMLDHKWFVASLLDYPRSGASLVQPRGPEAHPGGFVNDQVALYAPDAAGTVRPVDETSWVVITQRVEDVFPALPRGDGRHRAALLDRVAVGLPTGGSFAAEAAELDRLRGLGLTDLLVVKPGWQDPTALSPAQLPPAAAAGGAAGFQRLAAAAGLLAAAGAYTVTLPGCPGKLNPAYRPEDRVFGPDGQAKRLPDDAPGGPRCSNGVPMVRHLLAPGGAQVAYQQAWAGLKGLGVGATFLPELLAWSPAWPWPGATANVLDQAAAPAHPAGLGAAIQAYKGLFAAMRGQAPLVGDGAWGYWEAAYDSLYTGYVDGLWRSLGTGSPDLAPAEGGLVIPDFELAMVRPHVVGYGMGPYERFFGPEARAELTEEQLDTLRAFTLSFGHAGAWWAGGAGRPRLSEAEQAKEYFILGALGERYLDAPSPTVRYLAQDDSELDLSSALRRNLDLASPRLVLRYGSGLTLWLNHAPSAWPVVLGAELYELPPDGWLATGSGGLLAYSALIEGRRVDYLWTADYVLMDGRGRTTPFGPQSARDLKVVFADGRVLEEDPTGHLTLSAP